MLGNTARFCSLTGGTVLGYLHEIVQIHHVYVCSLLYHYSRLLKIQQARCIVWKINQNRPGGRAVSRGGRRTHPRRYQGKPSHRYGFHDVKKRSTEYSVPRFFIALCPDAECTGGELVDQDTGNNGIQNAEGDTGDPKYQDGHFQADHAITHQIGDH